MPIDLLDIERRVNESRQAFLDACNAYSTDDQIGMDIANNYLKRFIDDIDPRRAELARDLAREATQLVHDFVGERSNITVHVNLVNQSMHSAILSLSTTAVATMLDKAFQLPAQKQVGDPTSSLLDMLKSAVRTPTEEIEEAKQKAYERAAAVGERVINVQSLSTIALLMRHATYNSFKNEKLDVRWSDLSDRIVTQLKEESKDQLIQKSWDIVLDLTAEIGEIVIEEVSPLHKIPKYLKRVAKIVGTRTADTKAGGTDDMMKLLTQLRKESDLLKDLNLAYKEAMDDMGRPSANP